METTKESTSTKRPIHWQVDTSASETEMSAYWKRLRHYYRTGEKPEETNEKLTSALAAFLEEGESNYPYPLAKDGGMIEELNEHTPFLLLSHSLDEFQKENRRQFKSRLHELITGLNKLLQIENKGSEVDELKTTYDFADELIAFDKMVELIPKGEGHEITGRRLDRLKEILSSLQAGLIVYEKSNATIIVDAERLKKIDIQSVFKNAVLIKAQKDAFVQTQKLFHDQILSFTELIKAYRIATLEIANEYSEDIHDDYFAHFSWHRLLEDELNLFHPIVLLVDHGHTIDHLSSFSNLLVSNQPVNIFVLNEHLVTSPQNEVSWEDASHQFRQELAAIAISHRNVYTFQGGLDDPRVVRDGMTKCLKSMCPGICHLSIHGQQSFSGSNPMMISKGAAVSRFFPKVSYDPNKSENWSEKFDLQSNVQPNEHWPMFTLIAKKSEETEAQIDVAFTYADYKAMFASKSKELMLIPSKYYHEHLLPLSDYMELDEQLLYGKIPYIWLLDNERNLHRAAVPNVWVVSCQERLDFWNYLQEMGGSADRSKSSDSEDLNKAVKENTEQLEAKHQEVVKKIQEEAVGQAAERLIAVLLDDEELEFVAVGDAIPESMDPKTEQLEPEQPGDVKSDKDAGEVLVSSEPWVESSECTTCNDCTDKYPNLFKYNEENLAYIHDATKGTFEELVKAAENCPAECIHPGVPLNQKEPNLEKLMKRAEKFN